MSDIRLLVSAALNQGKTIKDINDSIKAIEKSPSLQKLKLKIVIDQKFSQSINQFIVAANKLKTILDDQNKVVSETQDVFKKLDGSITTVTQKVLKNGEIISKSKTLHDENKKSMQDEALAAQKLANAIDRQNTVDKDSITILKNKANAIVGYRVKSSQGYSATSTRLESDGQTLVNSSTTTNFKKERDDISKAAIKAEDDRYSVFVKNAKLEYDLVNQMADFREKSELRVREQQRATAEAQQRSIQKNMDMDRVETEAKIKNLEQFQAKYQDKITDLQRRFNKSIDSKALTSIKSDISNLDITSPDLEKKLRDIPNAIRRIGVEASTAASHSANFGESMRVAFQKFPVWMLTATIFYAPLRAISSMVSEIYALDTAMTDLKKVTDETDDTYAQFAKSASQTANQIGGLTIDVIKSTTEWARLGYNIRQAQSLAKETVVYQNVGDIKNAEDASKALIASIKGFGIEVDEQGKNVSHIVDVYNEVGNRFAISSAGIGDAVMRSASALSTAGNSLEQSVALITAANSNVQDPAKVGNALKTVSLRLRGISDEGENLGNLVPTLEKKFNTLGLSLKNSDSSFKSTYDIFQELSGVFDKLSDFQKADIIELVAGKEQANIVSGLLQNFNDAQGALEAGLNSTGSAARENATYIDSLAGHVAKFHNAVTSFYTNSMNSTFLKSVVDIGTSLIKMFDNLGRVVLIVSSAFIAFKSKAISTFIISSGNYLKALFSFNTGLKATAVVATETTAAVQGTTVAMTGLQRALGVIGIVISVGTILYSVLSNINSSNQDLAASVDKLNKKYDENASQINDVTEYYKANFQQIDKNNDIKEQLFQMQNKLIDTFGKEASGIDLVNGKYDEQISKLGILNKVLEENKIKENQIHIDAIKGEKYGAPLFNETTSSKIGSIFGKDKDYRIGRLNNDLQSSGVEEYYSKLLQIKDALVHNSENLYLYFNKIPKTTKEWDSALNAVNSEIEKIQPNMDAINQQEELIKNNIARNTVEQSKFNSEQQKMFDTVNKSLSSLPTDKYSKDIQTVAKTISTFDGKNFTQVLDQIKQLPDISGNTEVLSQLNQLSSGFVDTKDEAANYTDAITDLNETVDNTIGSFKDLASSYQSLHNGENLSLDTLLNLIDTYPQIAEYIAETNDLTLNKGELIKQVAEIQRQQHLEELQGLADEVKTTKEALEAKQQMYLQFYQAMSGALPAEQLTAIGNQLMTPEEQAALDAQTKQYQELQAKIKLLQKPINYDFQVSGGYKDPKKSKSTADKDAPTQADGTKATINAINAESEARSKLNEQLNTRADELANEGKYDDAIAKRTTLLASQVKELNLLSKANSDLKAKRQALDAGSSYNLSKLVDANGELTTSFYSTFNALGSKSAQEALQSLVDKYADYTKAINDNSDAMDANKTAQKDTQQNIKNTQKERDDKALNGTQVYLEKRAKMVAAYDKQIDDSKKRQSLYNEGSAEYNAETKVQIKLLADKEAFYTREIANTEARLKQGKLTNDQIKELNEYLETNRDALLDAAVAQAEYAKQWETNVNDAAQDALDVIEEYYQKQSELAQDALDKELSAYEEFIDERKKLLNRQDDTEDYNKQRTKLQQEELEIRKQIDVLSLDDTVEAKAKKVDLEKQLADKLEEIDDLQTDRTRQQRDDNLDDLQDVKQKEIKAEKEATDKKWKDALASDTYYSAIRQAQLEGNTAKLQSALQSFATNVQTYMDGIGKSIDMNITDKMAELQKFQDTVKVIGSAVQSNPSNSNSNNSTSSSPTSDPVYQKLKSDWQQFLSNKQKAEAMGSNKGKAFDDLKRANDVLVATHPEFAEYRDHNYQYLKTLNLFSADKGGMTPSWGNSGKIGILHEDELIANKLQTKDILKSSEILRDIKPWLNKIDFGNILTPKSASSSAGVAPVYLNVTIENMTADKNGVNNFFKDIQDGLKKSGR